MSDDHKGGEDQVVNQKVGTVRGSEQTQTPKDGVEILAEVYFSDGKNTEGYMLGVDGQLYHYNNLQHSISPYKQRFVNRLANPPHPVDVMLRHSKIEYADDMDDKGDRVIETGENFGKPVTLDHLVEPATVALEGSGTDGE